MTNDQPEAVDAPTPRPRRRRRLIIGIAAAAALSVAATVLAVVAINANRGPNFEAAVVDECGLNTGTDARILDNGDGLILNGAGEESSGLELVSTMCVLSALDVPDTTISRMEQTRSMDGRQKDDLDGYSVEWTYHPNDGLDVLLSK